MNVFTVDVEEWFHVCGLEQHVPSDRWHSFPSRVVPTTRRVLDLLDGAGVHATFFVVGWIAERYPELIREIAAAGHEIGSHGHMHRRVYELTPAQFAADLSASIERITAAGVSRPISFRAPEWSINDHAPWALSELVSQGFAADASRAPLSIVGRVDYPRVPHLLQTSAGPILELPPLVGDCFGCVRPVGWGWGLRMSSPRRVLRLIDRVNTAGHPAVLMVHPWELDPDPPRLRLPLGQQFAHYFCLGGFEARLREIVNAAPFATLSATVRCVSPA